jgi:uncharacterized protein
MITRRDLLAAACGSVFTAYGYGRLIERYVVTTERITMRLPELPDELVGLRIAQISDLHLRPHTTPEQIAKAVRQVNELAPDIIVITGDFITSSHKDAGELADILSGLKAPHGTYGSLGNHDCWNKPQVITQELERGGVQMLVNEHAELRIKGAPLCISGLDSAWAGAPDLRTALPADAKQPTILLAHEPDYADRVEATQRHLIQLSGHAHGGQVRVPGWGELVKVDWAKKYIHGPYRVGNVRLYVNRGIGCVSHPVRFACPPEITEITLGREV